jgi:hypothetical protein
VLNGEPHDGSFDPGSFRDPASRVMIKGDRVERVLTETGLGDWEALAATKFFAREVAAGRIIATEVAPDSELPAGARGLLSHARVPFWSYPYEWSFSMLRAAALLQLELLGAALAEGLTMKDATPYNFTFRGASPVFVDIGSFRRYDPGEPWLGYGQFCRTFLYPLMMRAHGDIAFQPLLRGSIDGTPPDHIRSVIRGARVLKPGGMLDVVMQARAERSLAASKRDLRGELTSAGFSIDMIKSNVKRLTGVIEKTVWRPRASAWSEYNTCAHVSTQRGPKEDFVRGVLDSAHRRLVWDLGANDGHFSRLAAGNADLVVAADADELVVDRLYQSLAEADPGNVLPLVFDLADPSPGLGWRGQERKRLEDRGRPDLVIFLAVIHHLVISANLPLGEVIEWLASLGAEVVFEWVPAEDPMARQIAVNKRKNEIHADYSEESLRALLRHRFEIRAESPLEQRTLFHLSPRS